ncbi:ABC transporter ATP-binding protein [Chloroflexi bacterium TSY]|nr:ABC transporter ATP-binding protein [Chloroflexi bacterium TSY]
MTVPLIEFRNVTKVFGGGLFDKNQTVALEKFSMMLHEDPPLITAIVGESGSGKTTLARLLLGLETPTEGQVLYRGQNVHRMNKEEHRRFLLDVQFIFQDPFGVYNPFYRVDHVLLKPLRKFNLVSSKNEAYAKIEGALETVGLRPEETLGRYPHQMSGGQRQRVMVARALLLNPKLIVADEPVSMVDASLRATILSNLQRLNEEYGISIIYITHDLATGYQISHNMLVLYHGAVVEVGDVDLVVNEPQHPYTQLLMDSIPQAVPERTWHQGGGETAAVVRPAVDHIGCKFADRCPAVMEQCREKVPSIYQTHAHRGVACFLHEETSDIAPESIEKLFATDSLPIT